jgi:hypothetical protein
MGVGLLGVNGCSRKSLDLMVLVGGLRLPKVLKNMI